MATSFVGRDADLAELERLFREGARLVTILGPAGVGKSRLAHAFSGEARRTHLSRARSPLDACRAIAQATGVLLPESASAEGALATLASELQGGLLVLDHFEQLLPEGRRLVESLAGSICLLVTSRERLRVPEEIVLDLAPLDPESARTLFLDRVRAVRADYHPSGKELDAIDRICEGLDRLPLAIELAAPRLRVVSASELLDRLPRRFEILAEPERSLRAALDSSWSLLDESERRLLAECTVFAGDFALDAAEAILEAPGNMLESLQSLRDKSLLYTEHTELGSRFGLYTSIREYAAAFLPPDSTVFERHRDHYLTRALRWAVRAEGPEALRALDSLLADQENLLAVHRRAIESSDPESALRAALALQPLLIARGPAALRLELLEPALERAEVNTHPLLIGWARLALGDTLFGMGRIHECVNALEAARRIGEHERDLRLLGRSLWRLSEVHRARGETELATPLVEKALELHREAGDRVHEGRCLASLGANHLDAGDLDRAAELFEHALERLEEVEDLHWIAHTTAYLAELEDRRGSVDEARALYQQAIDLHERCGSRRNLAEVLGALGALETELGNLEPAKARFDRAFDVLTEVPNRKVEGLLRLQLGAWHEKSRDRAAAQRSYRAATNLLQPLENRALLAITLAHLARTETRVAVARERLEEARTSSDHPIARALATIVSAQLGLEEDPATARAILSAPTPTTPLLRRAIEQLRDAQAGGLPARALVIADGWFKLPGGERVEIGAGRAPARLLSALARARVSGSGRSLSVEELFQAGWPSDRASSRAAASRVYVAVSTLRKLGLANLIIRNEEGYQLDPAVPIAEV